MKITGMIGHEIYDSRGLPTVQCEIQLDYKYSVIACVPASTLSSTLYNNNEAIEIRDQGARLYDKGVLKAIENIENIIAPCFLGKEPHAVDMDLKMIELDGTLDKSRLGANAMLASSMALYRAESFSQHIHLFELIAYAMNYDTVSLPFPLFTIISKKDFVYDNSLSKLVSEFIIIPVGTSSFRSALEIGVLIFHELERLLSANRDMQAIGSEGSFIVYGKEDNEILDLLKQALDAISQLHGISCVISLSINVEDLYDSINKLYHIQGRYLTSAELIKYYNNLIDNYPIFSLEDGMSSSDLEGLTLIAQEFSHKIHIVGNNLLASNIYTIHEAAQQNSVNSVVITPSHLGTVTETLQVIKLCKERGLNSIISGRSRETEDSFIADLGVGAQCGQIKAGGLFGSEHLVKYNRLLAIEDYLLFTLLDT